MPKLGRPTIGIMAIVPAPIHGGGLSNRQGFFDRSPIENAFQDQNGAENEFHQIRLFAESNEV